MCKKLGLLALFVLAGSLQASGQLMISNPTLEKDCAGDDIRVVEENGVHYIAAFFSNMDAVVQDQSRTIDKKRCTMRYNLQVAPGYQLEEFKFSVNGVYQLSDQGTGRLTVSHRVVNNDSATTTMWFKPVLGDPSSLNGSINNAFGSISKYQLPPQYSLCGSNIPLTTSIYAEAVKPMSDASGLTRVSLDEGVSSDRTEPYMVKLCQVVIKPCR